MHRSSLLLLNCVLVISLTQGSTSFNSRTDFDNLCQNIWNSAGSNLKIGQEIVLYSGRKAKPLITLTKQGKAKVQTEVFVKFQALLDNYEADENLHEKPSVTKQREEDAFIDAIIKTNRGPMQIVFDYLRKKSKVSMKCIDQFKPVLKEMWFEKYSKRGRGLKSSGFEHTFVGELGYSRGSITKITKGFHNWFQFLTERTLGRLTYHPPLISKDVSVEPALVRARFQWRGKRKPPGSSFFVGTSPDFEMALYTACFFEGTNCSCKLNGKQLSFKTIKFYNKRNILTAYPTV